MLFFSSIIMWPLLRIPASVSRSRVLTTPCLSQVLRGAVVVYRVVGSLGGHNHHRNPFQIRQLARWIGLLPARREARPVRRRLAYGLDIAGRLHREDRTRPEYP